MAEGGKRTPPAQPPAPTVRYLLLGFVALWLGVQILLPLRHLLYPGSVHWTEEGHKFSWMMKLRDKEAIAEFTVFDPAGGTSWLVEPDDYLLRHQARKVASRPDMILQYAHYLERLWSDEFGVDDVEVRVHACVSLNGRPAALMIDPERDLTQVRREIGVADWILPLDVPFERPPERTRRYELRC